MDALFLNQSKTTAFYSLIKSLLYEQKSFTLNKKANF
jgi:hypothetical protein